MNKLLLASLSGPLMALVRYGIAAGGAAVVAHNWADGATVSTVGAGVAALASAILGMLTSSQGVATVRTADVTGQKVILPSGQTVTSGAQAASAITGKLNEARGH